MKYIFVFLALVISINSFAQHEIEWNDKLSLPAIDGKASIGLAGAYCGIVDDYLIVAGGANFPDGAPWRGAAKKWHSTIYYKNIKSDSCQWKILKNGLPSPIAYGVSIEMEHGLLCIGGCDSNKCYDELMFISIEKGEIKITYDFPKLPTPLANATGAKIGDRIYVAGGNETMADERATSHFFMLDISNMSNGWQKSSSWEGAARGYAVSATQNNSFFIFSGRNYSPENGIDILNDGYVYNTTDNSWKQLSGKFPVMAGSALSLDNENIALIGGTDTIIQGSDTHPGFGSNILIYNTTKNKLIHTNAPFQIAVTTSIARHDSTFYIGSGEIKPGIRTPTILQGTIINKQNKTR